MQCNRLVLAAETQTRAYYTSMRELQHHLAPGEVGTDLGFSQSESREAVFESEWFFLSLELCGGKSFLQSGFIHSFGKTRYSEPVTFNSYSPS